MKEFDVVVVGGGPGGYVAAVRASQLGLRTALVEKGELGGMCVNWGCIPTKALLRNAEVVYLLGEGKTYGFKCSDVVVDYAAAHTRSRQIARRQRKRVEILLKSRNVEIFNGEAYLEDATTVAICSTGEKLRAKNIILATGSSARVIKGMEFNGEQIISARNALSLNRVPASVVIIGAGPIGMEFATLWRRYGSDVTVVEMMPHVLPTEDSDVCQEAAAQFKKAGIKIRVGAMVQGITNTGQGVEITVAVGNIQEIIIAEKVLVATGFAPNTSNLGLEQAGVQVNRGYVETDADMRTNVPHIFAIGDITGKLGLAHVASAQGLIAAEAIAGYQRHSNLIYENIPRCIFGCVEVASVGLTESQAKEQGYTVITALSPFVPNGKAVALGENVGFVKLVADSDSRKLLGAHMIGPHVTELIAGPATVLAMGGTIEQLSQTVYAHPTLSEAVLEGAHLLSGHAIHL